MSFSRTSSGDALVGLTWSCVALQLGFGDKRVDDATLQRLVSLLGSVEVFLAVEASRRVRGS